MTDIEPTEPVSTLGAPCKHCGGGPDTVLVAKRIVTYEFHRPSCPVLTDEVTR